MTRKSDKLSHFYKYNNRNDMSMQSISCARRYLYFDRRAVGVIVGRCLSGLRLPLHLLLSKQLPIGVGALALELDLELLHPQRKLFVLLGQLAVERIFLGVAPSWARPFRRHVLGDGLLLGRQDVEGRDHAKRDVLLHVAVELPHARNVSLEADHSPAPLPHLEAVFAERGLQVLLGAVLGGVVLAPPVELLDATLVVVVRVAPVLGRARVLLLRRPQYIRRRCASKAGPDVLARTDCSLKILNEYPQTVRQRMI